MLGNGEGSTMKIGDGVARFAAIIVGCGGELIVVRVLVAIGAGRELYVVNGVFACRDVAARTGNAEVLAFQRIGGTVVFVCAE